MNKFDMRRLLTEYYKQQSAFHEVDVSYHASWAKECLRRAWNSNEADWSTFAYASANYAVALADMYKGRENRLTFMLSNQIDDVDWYDKTLSEYMQREDKNWNGNYFKRLGMAIVGLPLA